MLSDKQINQAFKEIINKQLEPHKLTYEDVICIPDWYIKYTTTEKENKEWIQWSVDLLNKKYKMPKYQAKKEMAWVNLTYGLYVA